MYVHFVARNPIVDVGYMKTNHGDIYALYDLWVVLYLIITWNVSICIKSLYRLLSYQILMMITDTQWNNILELNDNKFTMKAGQDNNKS